MNDLSGGYNFDPTILKEYDIRGQIGKTLSATDAFALGRAFGTYIKRNHGDRVCVAYDGRHSSPDLAKALIEGLCQTGIDVENVGMGPSPLLYFVVKDLMADAGIMITGSHNPPDYNGFKMMLQNGPVYGEKIQEIGRIAASGDFENGEGKERVSDVQDLYVDRLLRDYYGQSRPLKVVWDCGNGASGEIVRRLTAKLPGEHILLFDEIDGNFPNHHPDPTVDKNLEDLIRVVREQNCDFGVAFDGDGDRIGAVDEKGNIIRSDILLAIYARGVLEEFPHAQIIGDVKCSQVLYNEIERLGGRPVMWKVGHSLIKAKMSELKSPLAGELSGHIFFADKYYGFDDGIYCAVRLMNEIADSEGALSGLVDHMPVLHTTPEYRFEVDESQKFAYVERIVASLKGQFEGEDDQDHDFDILDIDGVRVSTSHGWWLMRASNTQNMLVTRAEADSAEHLEMLKKMVEMETEKAGCVFKFPVDE